MFRQPPVMPSARRQVHTSSNRPGQRAGYSGQVVVAGTTAVGLVSTFTTVTAWGMEQYWIRFYRDAMLVVVWVAVALWALGEVGLQLTQLLRSERTKTREWGSYGGIAVTALVGVALAGLARRMLPGLDFPSRATGWSILIAVLVVLGGGFRLWSIAALGRYFRAVVHIQEGHRVVRSGPYRVLRHPSYTGLLVSLLGVSLLWGNYASSAVFWVLVLLGVLYRIRVEERVLLDGLGDDYAVYMRETNRLIPGVW